MDSNQLVELFISRGLIDRSLGQDILAEVENSGKEAAEIGYDQNALVVRVAATPKLSLLAAGLDDGRVWVADLKSGKMDTLKAERGAAISALAITADGGRVAWGDEDGAAGVVERD